MQCVASVSADPDFRRQWAAQAALLVGAIDLLAPPLIAVSSPLRKVRDMAA
jgi:hypothetical protein